jgi:hypothetical protein
MTDWQKVVADIEPDDWTRSRTDLELAEILAEHRLEITQPGMGECGLEYDENVQEVIAEVLRRVEVADRTLCDAGQTPPTAPVGDSSCSDGSMRIVE